MPKQILLRVSRSGFIACLALFFSLASGQIIVTPVSTPIGAPIDLEFEVEQQVLVQSLAQLVDEEPSSDQLNAWTVQNQVAVQSQQTLALQLGAMAADQPMAYITSVSLPDGASQNEIDFLDTQADLENTLAQIHGQLLAQGVVSGNTESNLFQQQAGADLQSQPALAQGLTSDAGAVAMTLPGSSAPPVGSSSTLQSFLTLQNQLLTGLVTVHNQNAAGTEAVREAALAQWQQQNAALFQQLSQLAQNLATTATVTSSPLPTPTPQPIQGSDETN